MKRIKLAWRILRGRSVVYRVKIVRTASGSCYVQPMDGSLVVSTSTLDGVGIRMSEGAGR